MPAAGEEVGLIVGLHNAEVQSAKATLTPTTWVVILCLSAFAGGFGGYLGSLAGKATGGGPAGALNLTAASKAAPALANELENRLAPASCTCMKCDGEPWVDSEGNWCAARASSTAQPCVQDVGSAGCYSTLSDYDCSCPSTVGAKVTTGVNTECKCLVCGMRTPHRKLNERGEKYVGQEEYNSGTCPAAASPAGQNCLLHEEELACVSSLDDYDCICPGTVGPSRTVEQLKKARKDVAGRAVMKKDHCGLSGSNGGTQISSSALYANGSCACAAICSNTIGCAGWTYAPSSGQLNSSSGELNSCFLLSTWAAMASDSPCPSDNPCYSAPVDPCGMPWAFKAKQQSTVSASSSCECKNACEKIEECDAWTYHYDYNGGKDNCWIQNAAGDGTDVGTCYDECFAGQKIRAKCGAGRYLSFDSYSSIKLYSFTADDPCACAKECVRSESECKAWTYQLGSGGAMKDSQDNTCILYSTVTLTKACSDCVSDLVSGHAQQISELEHLNAEQEAQQSQAALEKTVCLRVTNQTGNFSYIASPTFPGEEPWPVLDKIAYAALSRLLTTVRWGPFSESTGVQEDHITVTEDVRSTYPLVIGTTVARSYQAVLADSYAMEDARKRALVGAAEWKLAVVQIAKEVRYLGLLGDWFNVYSQLFALAGEQVFEAFTTTASIVSMPGTTQVASTKVHTLKIVLKVLSSVATIGLMIATDGTFIAAKGAEKATKDAEKADKEVKEGAKGLKAAKEAAAAKKVADGFRDSAKSYEAVKKSMANIQFISANLNYVVTLAQDGIAAANIAPATAGGSNPEAASDADVSEYYDFIANVQAELNAVWRSTAAERLILAGNYGRLSQAAAAAEACPISGNELEVIVSETYGAMQWLALGVLLPKKYAIYWQRDYMGTKGPNCYYNNCGGGTSSGQCGSSTSDVLGCKGTTMGCYEPSYSPYDNSDTKDSDTYMIAKRAVWMGQQNNPSEVPAEDMWAALSDGPVTSYINRKFKTMYTGSYGAFEAFVSQCAYVSKVYIPGGDITYSETQTSTVKVDCDVYGITIPTYAFMDCGTQVSKDGVVWNGYGINSDGTSGDGTGNFNQMTYIPNKPNSWATYADGQVGCCSPWKGSDVSPLPAGCDYILCDCYSIAIMAGSGDVDSNSDGQSASDHSGTWWNGCVVDTGSPSEKQYVQTSFGPKGPWPRIVTSGNQYASMPGLEDVALT